MKRLIFIALLGALARIIHTHWGNGVGARVKWLEKRYFRRTGRPSQREQCEGQ